ncbi:HeH/LEM domain-containing protein [Niallia taxi]|uniref:HeH/LEM domain-containing protein n=1 Tax=Niallia taxi TaxID=2499688 RepID=A0A437KH64_9BACI|nr:HeH/LEM domain-containing protein [Niallia taxi]RVT67656.1 hypothetical protein EM808_04055 [Niallia taxi]
MSNTLKVEEIKEKLTAAGISFDEKMKKEDLLRLLEDSTQNENDATSSEETAPVVEPKKKYVVVHDFKDLKDGTVYIKGDIYPRKADAVVDEERVKELSSTKNKIGRVLIQEQE